jgi:uncharacterized cupin superfamily protein
MHASRESATVATLTKEGPELEAGSWKLEAGSWKLEAGSWKLEAGSWKLTIKRTINHSPPTS